MTTFYENLLKATDNTESITHEKYATVTKVYDDNTCDLIEDINELQHEKAIIPSNQELKEGNKVIIGFVNNNIYDPFVMGVLNNPQKYQYHIVSSNNNYICYANNLFVYIILRNTFNITSNWQEITGTIPTQYCPKNSQFILMNENMYAKLNTNGKISVKIDGEQSIKTISGSFIYPLKDLLGD